MNKEQMIEEMVDKIFETYKVKELFAKSKNCALRNCFCIQCGKQTHRVFLESEAAFSEYFTELIRFIGNNELHLMYLAHPGSVCSADCFKKQYIIEFSKDSNYLKLL